MELQLPKEHIGPSKVKTQARMEKLPLSHSYDILGAGMLWKPKKTRKFVKIP
jgi:hypothetical protein